MYYGDVAISVDESDTVAPIAPCSMGNLPSISPFNVMVLFYARRCSPAVRTPRFINRYGYIPTLSENFPLIKSKIFWWYPNCLTDGP